MNKRRVDRKTGVVVGQEGEKDGEWEEGIFPVGG
jgi:hypothetical protein